MKNPKIAAFSSLILWGTGQLYNGQVGKAIFFFVLQIGTLLIELLTGNYFLNEQFAFRNMGFFGKGIWGILTLGTQTSILTERGLSAGDNSVMLLIQGIIAVILLAIIVGVWYLNVKDAYVTAKEISESNIAISSRGWLKKTWENSFEYLIMIPSAFMLLMFVVMPMIFSFLVAFTNYNNNNMPPTNLLDWVGLSNFSRLFSLGNESGTFGGDIWLHTFLHVFLWTVLFAVLSTVIPFFLGLFQAVVLNNKRVKAKKVWRSVLILPWAMPAILSQLNFQQLLNGQFGPINRMLLNLGVIDSPIFWLSDPNNPWLPRMTIVLIGIWLGFPYFMALMSGVMTSISKDIYEAAEIDGANEKQQFWKITLPLVLSATAPLLIMNFASNFNNFGLIYFLTGGGPINPNFIHAGQTDILISWIFKLTLDQRMYDMAAVMSIIIFLVIGTISAWNFTRTKSFKEGA
ncbi:MAG: sugar ABC transporter permease [Turicibacter sp.]|nr:sugar ABC transporter permease [Turicibacter sp.]